MKSIKYLFPIILTILLKVISANIIISDYPQSFVVSSYYNSEDFEEVDFGFEENIIKTPRIDSMNIQTDISNRYATTLVTTKVSNSNNSTAETTFSFILPESAFVSEFLMEIGQKSYRAYVKPTEEAAKIYNEAISSGQTAAHVQVNARNSRAFTVSVNIEAETKATFHLKYEELLERTDERYELALNIRPGQVVEDLNVQVRINETRPLRFVEVPALRSGNEIGKIDDENLETNAEISLTSRNSAVVTFNPSLLKQREFAQGLGTEKENGLDGQLVVQYDVDRDSSGGEVLIRDGYFVHFFAPEELDPLPKHIVFVLDHSGSMSGGKIRQLAEAMTKILSQLRAEDVFNIVRFTDKAYVWDMSRNNSFSPVDDLPKDRYGSLDFILEEKNLPQAVEGSAENIAKATDAIRDSRNLGWTNIVEGLEVGLFLTRRVKGNYYQPMILFLTDGAPNFGLHSTDEITKVITELNDKHTAIFSLSFGNDADKSFLQKLSLSNLGFSRHIYEAADAALQLQAFYKLISSPLLYNVTFKYLNDSNSSSNQITRTHHPILFKGAEIVVAGKLSDALSSNDISIKSFSKNGSKEFRPEIVESDSSLERLWAYLSVKQFLEKRELLENINRSELTERALEIAMKYSFVTPITSLVVVKPNDTKSVDGIDLDNGDQPPMRNQLPKAKKGTKIRVMRKFRPNPRFGGGDIAPRTLALSAPLIEPPKWLQELSKNGTITINSNQIYKLGKSGDVYERPNCPKPPRNGQAGECTIIFDCPSIFPILTDIDAYLAYFCPLGTFAGVCCPNDDLN